LMAKAKAATTPLQEISPDDIRKNRDNPRLIFLEEEMNQLLESIQEVGIKVPLSVYANGNHYVLLDGERRWRCARKLNLKYVPAIVQPKPTRLENLLMMFNIHNVRVDWDLLPMALKLGEIRQLLEAEGRDASAKALSAVTGVRLPTVRRALELLDLPKKYQRLLLREAEKPRNERRIKADLFIEIYKSFNAIARHAPSVLEDIGKAEYVDSMVAKYVSGVIDNVVAFRDISKIARAELAGADSTAAAETLLRLARDPGLTIAAAYEETVQGAYAERDITSRAEALTRRLRGLKRARIGPRAHDALGELHETIERVLRR
jgi:ParB family transcriptional regulator, chromosome partitioning protein